MKYKESLKRLSKEIYNTIVSHDVATVGFDVWFHTFDEYEEPDYDEKYDEWLKTEYVDVSGVMSISDLDKILEKFYDQVLSKYERFIKKVNNKPDVGYTGFLISSPQVITYDGDNVWDELSSVYDNIFLSAADFGYKTSSRGNVKVD